MLEFSTVAAARKDQILATRIRLNVLVRESYLKVFDMDLNKVLWVEEIHSSLTEDLNNHYPQTSFVVTRTVLDATSIIFQVYMRSLSYKTRIIKYKWKYSPPSKCFIVTADDVYLTEGLLLSKEDNRLMHEITPFIETCLLYLPEFRLRYATGELIQAMKEEKVQ